MITELLPQIRLIYQSLDFATGDVTYKGDTVEAIVKDDNGATYFDESSFRSAPYFQIRIDGITELNK